MRVAFVTSVIRVRGTNGKLSLGMVIGRLGSERKFAYEGKHENKLPHCTSVAIG